MKPDLTVKKRREETSADFSGSRATFALGEYVG